MICTKDNPESMGTDLKIQIFQTLLAKLASHVRHDYYDYG